MSYTLSLKYFGLILTFDFFDEVIITRNLLFFSLQGFVVSSYFIDILKPSQWKPGSSFKPHSNPFDVLRGYRRRPVAWNGLNNWFS